MPRHRTPILLLPLLLASLVLTACSTLTPKPPETQASAAEAAQEEAPRRPSAAGSPAPRAKGGTNQGTWDPLERFNRAMFTFNEHFDRYLMKPVAKGYRAVVPRVVRRGVANFFSNLGEPITIVNDLLQGKPRQAGSDSARFLINSTLGVFGLIDVATHMGLQKNDEDFGQTLAVWGVGDGPYLVLPILGPSNFRDGFGRAVDYYYFYPPAYGDSGTRSKLAVMGAVSTRAQLLDATDILEQAAGEDPYIFLREFYRQRRRHLVHDGSPPLEVPEFLFEDEKR
jgi:phospholipid-binding lipoprotein MlaA